MSSHRTQQKVPRVLVAGIINIITIISTIISMVSKAMNADAVANRDPVMAMVPARGAVRVEDVAAEGVVAARADAVEPIRKALE